MDLRQARVYGPPRTRARDRSFCRRIVSADTVPMTVHQDRLTLLKSTLIVTVFSHI
jgi:hypothetical protein